MQCPEEPDFLDVEKFPEITFKSTGVTSIGDGTFEMTGDLTIHGVTQQVALQAWMRVPLLR